MVVYSAKEIVDGIVRNNPFWEHYICIEGVVKKDERGFYIELDDKNSLPLAKDNEKTDLLNKGKSKYYGFINYRDQEGFGEQNPNRTINVHFERGILNFEFYIVKDINIDKYSMKSRMMRKMAIYNRLQNIWRMKDGTNKDGNKKVKVAVICSEEGCAYTDIETGLKLNDILKVDDFYELKKLETNFEVNSTNNCNADLEQKQLKKDFLSKIDEANKGDFDIVIISRGGTSKEKGYGILNDEDIKIAIANMNKPTICAIGHAKDYKNNDSFHNVFDFDAVTPSLAGVRLREWLLAFKTIPEK